MSIMTRARQARRAGRKIRQLASELLSTRRNRDRHVKRIQELEKQIDAINAANEQPKS